MSHYICPSKNLIKDICCSKNLSKDSQSVQFDEGAFVNPSTSFDTKRIASDSSFIQIVISVSRTQIDSDKFLDVSFKKFAVRCLCQRTCMLRKF